MKHIILLILFISIPASVFSQTKIERSVINTCGADYKGTNFSVSYSIGEAFVETEICPTIKLTQGFQQPTESGTDVRPEEVFPGIKVYPNPTQDKIIVDYSNCALSDINNYYITVVNLNGEEILFKENLSDLKTIIDFSAFANGTYFLNIRNKVNIKRIKIVKSN